MAKAMRVLTIDAVEAANAGHPGMPRGMADVATRLEAECLKSDPQNPKGAERDRRIASAGHGPMLMHALAYGTGEAEMSLDEIKNFRQ
jgi:Transketolase